MYIGSFKNNLRHGKGMVRYADGSKFRGSFHSGVKHDVGVRISPKGTRTEELWRNGSKYR